MNFTDTIKLPQSEVIYQDNVTLYVLLINSPTVSGLSQKMPVQYPFLLC